MTAKSDVGLVPSSLPCGARRALALFSTLLALVGTGISAYLTFVHYSGIPLYCEEAGGCHAVQSGQYATLLGLPVELLGLVLYTALFSAATFGLRASGQAAEIARFLVFAMALFGLLYSAYLTWHELYRIYAICAWCIASAFVLGRLTLTSGAQLIVSGRLRGGPAKLA